MAYTVNDGNNIQKWGLYVLIVLKYQRNFWESQNETQGSYKITEVCSGDNQGFQSTRVNSKKKNFLKIIKEQQT